METIGRDEGLRLSRFGVKALEDEGLLETGQRQRPGSKI